MANKAGDVKVFFAVDGLELPLHVLRFSGEEALSRLFEFSLELACDTAALAAINRLPGQVFGRVVGRPALLMLQRESGEVRYVQGMVNRFQQRRSGRKYSVFSASLVPRAWLLKQRTDCRIFQNLPANTIVSGRVLAPAHVRHVVSCKGNAAPPTREYSVQYRESDWSYASRLLEEEGYFYFFQHSDREHVLQIANHEQVYTPITGDDAVLFQAPGGTTPAEEHVSDFNYAQGVISGQAALGDYNPWTPGLNLGSSAAQTGEWSDGSSHLEVFDHPGNYTTPEEGKALARVRQEELQVQRQEGEGTSDCVRLVPGSTFELRGDPDRFADRAYLLGRRYLVTRVIHSAHKHQDLEAGAVSDRCGYSNTFCCIPADVPFRPARTTRRPHVPGAQTAVVVGPGEQEIHTDKHGRVKVQFHWDRYGAGDDHSSCWVRVSQLWAGQRYGAMFIPRVGHEVIVEFLEGDPDRPIITGRVYHATNPPPLNLPEEATRSTIKSESTPGGGGFNELRFEDKKGSEELYLHAEKDMTEAVGNNQSSSVGHNRSATIQKNDTLTVATGNRKTEVTEGKSDLTAKKTIKVHSTTKGVQVLGKEVRVVGKGEMAGVSIDGYPQVRATSTGTVHLGIGPAVGPAQVSTTLDDSGVKVVGMGAGAGVSITGEKEVKASSNDATITLDAAGITMLDGGGTGTLIDGSATRVVLIAGASKIFIEPGGIYINAGGDKVMVTGGKVKISGSEIELN